MDILIIEDNTLIRNELKILLEKNGYNAVIIKDFTNIISFVKTSNPHLILLDLGLPVFDGYHICKEIRKYSNVPIIVVTSRNSDIDELMSMNFGADDFITKPYNSQILLARIDTILSRVYSTHDIKNIIYGAITLDISKSIMTINNKSSELTKNEIRILTLLIKNKGAITSRDDIMNVLWQSNEFVDDNTLTVNINRLRKKLDEISTKELLKTKRGQGYLLCE